MFTVEKSQNENFESCVKSGKYKFESWTPRTAGKREILSNVQSLHAPSGLASLCDWVIGSRLEHWKQLPDFTAWGNIEKIPETIFIQTDKLSSFTQVLLPCFPFNNSKITLIVGDHDKTTPTQLDKRYEDSFLGDDKWDYWLRDDRIKHIYVEHLDIAQSEKVTAIPLGLNPFELQYLLKESELRTDDFFMTDYLFKFAKNSPVISKRPLQVLDASRQRKNSEQFKERYKVGELCQKSHWCDYKDEIPTGAFMETIQNYSFVLCAHGGGIDPNPKLFMSLLGGAIPIIRNWPAASMYNGWPVVRIESWNEITYAKLKVWRHIFAPMFMNKALREQTLEYMTLMYWWRRIKDS